MKETTADFDTFIVSSRATFEKTHILWRETSYCFLAFWERNFNRLHSILSRNFSRIFTCCQDKKNFPKYVPNISENQSDFEKVNLARMEKQPGWGLVGCFRVVKRFSDCAEKQWKPKNSCFNWRANIFLHRFRTLSKKVKKPVLREKPEPAAKNNCMKIKAEYYSPGEFFHEMKSSWSEKLKASSFWLRANTHGTVGGKKLSSTCVNFPIDQLDEKWNFRKNNKFLSIGTLTKTFELLTNKNPQEFQNWILLSRAKYWETRIFVREKNTFGNLEFFSKIVKTSFHRQEELFGDKYLSWRRKGFS